MSYGVCYRCGRKGHMSNRCFAKRHVSGRYLKPKYRRSRRYRRY